jgi:hypothetical protein
VSTDVNDRWDKNLTGFRAEEEIGFNGVGSWPSGGRDSPVGFNQRGPSQYLRRWWFEGIQEPNASMLNALS